MPSKYIPHPRPHRSVTIPIGPSIAYVPLTQDKFACIDADDAQRVNAFNWFARFDPSVGFYASSHGPSRTPSSINLHVFILGKREGYTVDHKQTGNGLDCRRTNLRHANHSEQAQNKGMLVTNASGFKGVGWYPKYQCWRARITAFGRVIHLGYFEEFEGACAARKEATERYHGKFARLA